MSPNRKNCVAIASVFLCALLSMAGCSKKTQEKAQQTIDDAKATASSAAQDAKQQASDAADKAKQQASDAADQAKQKASDASDSANAAARKPAKGATVRERCRLPGYGSRQGKSEKSCRRRKGSG